MYWKGILFSCMIISALAVIGALLCLQLYAQESSSTGTQTSTNQGQTGTGVVLCPLHGFTAIQLSAGWNFLAFPRLPSNPAPIETVLADVVQKVSIVWGYDNITKQWCKWKPGLGSPSLTSMEFGKGYWMYLTDTGTINVTGWLAAPSTAHLFKGWNLVGYGFSDTNIDTPLEPISNKWSTVWNWSNGAWKARHSTLHSLPVSPLTSLDLCKAYWILMKETATLVLPRTITGTMEPGKGYWVYTEEEDRIDMSNWDRIDRTATLYSGWNLVGYNGAHSGDTSLLTGESGWTSIWTFTDDRWYEKNAAASNLSSLIQPLTDLRQGKAYWVKRITPLTTTWADPGDTDATHLVLSKGWNLVSLTRQPPVSTLENILDLSKAGVVWRYDSQSKAWVRIMTGGGGIDGLSPPQIPF